MGVDFVRVDLVGLTRCYKCMQGYTSHLVGFHVAKKYRFCSAASHFQHPLVKCAWPSLVTCYGCDFIAKIRTSIICETC